MTCYYRGTDTVTGTVSGNAVHIRWQSTDFSEGPTASTSAPETTTISQNTYTKSPEPTLQSHAGLTVGAKAGIGLGVSLGVIFAFVVSVYLYNARRKGHKSPPKTHEEPEDIAEADGQPRFELPTPTYFTQELPTQDLPPSEISKAVELD